MFKKIIIILILIFIFPSLVLAEEKVDQTESTKQALVTFSTKYNISDTAIFLYREGKLQSIYLGDTKPTTQFNVNALSDILTGLVLAQQFDTAKLQLNAPLKQFYQNTSDQVGNITLRSLSTDTSGLPLSATESYLTKKDQEVAVDENWQPSSFGRTILTNILEKATHKNLAELYQHQIFSVLDMHNIKLTATGLMSSASDMQKFLSAAIGLPGTPEIVLYPMRLTQTAFIELSDRELGLGWNINVKELSGTEEIDTSVNEAPSRPVFKSDSTYEKIGSNFYLAVIPSKKTGVVILLSKPVNEKELAELGKQILLGSMA